MPRTLISFRPLFLMLLMIANFSQSTQAQQTNPDDVYQLGADSQRQDGVSQGTVTKHEWTSQIFEGTDRKSVV